MPNPDAAPRKQTLRADIDAAAAAVDATHEVGVATFDGTVTAVRFVAATVLTGANTESRTHSLINKGQAGAGTTVVATRAYVSTVNAPASDQTDLTLSATAADLLVVAGDVLALASIHVGATGLADPGGVVEVDITSR